MGIISRIIQAIRSFLNRRKKRILLSQKEEVIKLNELVQSLKNHPHYLIEREKFSIISKVRKTYLPNLKGIENEIETKHYNALQEIHLVFFCLFFQLLLASILLLYESNHVHL